MSSQSQFQLSGPGPRRGLENAGSWSGGPPTVRVRDSDPGLRERRERIGFGGEPVVHGLGPRPSLRVGPGTRSRPSRSGRSHKAKLVRSADPPLNPPATPHARRAADSATTPTPGPDGRAHAARRGRGAGVPAQARGGKFTAFHAAGARDRPLPVQPPACGIVP